MVWRTLPRFELTLPRCDGFELTLPVGGRSTDTLPRRRGTTVRPMAQVEFGCRPSSQRPALPTSLASCTPPHAPAQPPDNRTPPGAKFLCFISSLQRHALVKTSKEIISSRVKEIISSTPEPCYCVESVPAPSVIYFDALQATNVAGGILPGSLRSTTWATVRDRP